MNEKQEPKKGYMQKITEFGEAVKTKGYDAVACEDAKDFVNTFAKRLGGITKLATTVAERNAAKNLAWSQDLRGRDYQDVVGPYEQNCFSAQESAATDINVMNRCFKAVGLAPFADVDTKDPRAIQKVSGDLVVECQEDRTPDDLEDTFTKAVEKEAEQPGQATRKLFALLEKNTDGGEGKGASTPGVV